MTQHGMALCIVIKPLPPHEVQYSRVWKSALFILEGNMNLDDFFTVETS